MAKLCECGSGRTFKLDTYKRHWWLCNDCGGAFSEDKATYPLNWTKIEDLVHDKNKTEAAMYDYFTDPGHIEWSINEGKDFVKNYIQPLRIELNGLRVLDISGGNGHAVDQLSPFGVKISLSEINQKAIDYAKATHPFPVYYYDINTDNLSSVITERQDVVLIRASIMFAKNLEKFISDIREILRPNGLVIVNHSVIPTLGVLLRTQLDQFSYYKLRSPNFLEKKFSENNFEKIFENIEVDPDMYVYDNDLLNRWRYIHNYYEWKNIKTINENRNFSFAARDRRRATICFKFKD